MCSNSYVGRNGCALCTLMLKPMESLIFWAFWAIKHTFHNFSLFSLYVCWKYFNAGADYVFLDNGHNIGLIRMNTFISGAAGSLSVFILFYLMN